GRNGIELAMQLGDAPPKAGPIRGVLVATEQSGGDTVTVPMEIAADFSAGAQRGPTGKPAHAAVGAAASGQGHASLPALLLLAILGGLILNLMPCVFPVLSIKALGLVEQAKKHPAAVRAKGLVFAAGVISSMLCLAAVLLVLRAGGEQIGWGFQLQSPLFVTLLVYLLLAVGLNLSGVFEIGGGLAGVGDSLTQGDSYRAAYFTGVLTTLVATPCTAPYMAFAVGAALTQPPGVWDWRCPMCCCASLPGCAAHCPSPVRGWTRSNSSSPFRFTRRQRGCCGCSHSKPRPSAWARHWPAPFSSPWRRGRTRNPNRARAQAGQQRW